MINNSAEAVKPKGFNPFECIGGQKEFSSAFPDVKRLKNMMMSSFHFFIIVDEKKSVDVLHRTIASLTSEIYYVHYTELLGISLGILVPIAADERRSEASIESKAKEEIFPAP